MTARKWKCGASLALPLAGADEPWDAGAATASIFDLVDLALVRRAFLAYDAASPRQKGSYRMPFAKATQNGDLVASPSGLAEAARFLERAVIPQNVRSQAQAVLKAYTAEPYPKAARRSRAI